MAYAKYTSLKNAAEILEKISAYTADNGWTILDNCIDDTAIDGSGSIDGKRLGLKSPDGKVFAIFRSANGKKIFDDQNNDMNAYGIGLICADAYSSQPASGKWYDQANAPIEYTSQKVIGVGIPVNPQGSYTLIINTFDSPATALTISISPDIEVTADKISESSWQHLVAGYLQKIGDWDGGMFFSGSRNSKNMFTAATDFNTIAIETESSPLCSTSKSANTFLRAEIDAAPDRNPAIHWASAGDPQGDCFTGKQLSTPILDIGVKQENWLPRLPDYSKLQSKDSLDSGNNVNTLNCITVNMNIIFYVLRDPDALQSFSPCGYVPGIYYISMLNLAPTSAYEVAYPKSGNLHQAMPFTRRRGRFGFDGFSIQQTETDS